MSAVSNNRVALVLALSLGWCGAGTVARRATGPHVCADELRTMPRHRQNHAEPLRLRRRSARCIRCTRSIFERGAGRRHHDGHPTMPEFRLDPGQIGDVIAYLKTLER